MEFLKRKKKEVKPTSLQEEAMSVQIPPSGPSEASSRLSPQSDLASASASSRPQEPSRLSSRDQDPSPESQLSSDDLLDPTLIGQTIKLVRADNWEQDVVPTLPHETHILYENQRGMFFFGKPYFSSNSLISNFKFDPPPFQRTNSFLATHAGKLDNSDEMDWERPHDPLKLYYSPYSPRDPFLSLDSVRGNAWRWKQDRWYVDMRGDVDEEGWEYAFYWNGRYKWCGGNWHGKSVLIHGWVRRRKWMREFLRIQEREKHVETKEAGEKHEYGGFEGLLRDLRGLLSPSVRREILEHFFDVCLDETMKLLESTIDLIRLIEQRITNLSVDADEELLDTLTSSLDYLNSKREALVIRPGILPSIRNIHESQWDSYEKKKDGDHPTRRIRLRILREEWRRTHQSPTKLFRKVRFAGTDTPDSTEYFTALETTPRRSTRRSSSVESREEWFIAPEQPGGPLEPSKSVAGLLREGGLRELKNGNSSEVIAEEPDEIAIGSEGSA